VKLLYLGILYRFISGKNILSKNLCRFIKGVQKLEPILSLYRCRKIFLCFFYRFISAGKLFLGFFYRVIGAGKLVFGFFYRFIGAGKLYLVFSIASSEKKILPNKIVSLYLIFISKIVYRYCFNRYIFEYRCPPLYNGRD
jgi:hypothetical protein